MLSTTTSLSDTSCFGKFESGAKSSPTTTRKPGVRVIEQKQPIPSQGFEGALQNVSRNRFRRRQNGFFT